MGVHRMNTCLGEMVMADIKLGSKVKDMVSDFTGTATSRHTSHTGEVQIGITPKVSKKSPEELPRSSSFDQVQVKVVGVGLSKTTPAIPKTFGFELGEEVECLITGYRGVAVTRHDYMNGCVMFKVVPKGASDKGETKEENFRWQVLKRVGDGILKQTAPHSRGGPAHPVPSHSL